MAGPKTLTFVWDFQVDSNVPEKDLERALATSIAEYLDKWCDAFNGREQGLYVVFRTLVGPHLMHRGYPGEPRPNVFGTADEERAELAKRESQARHPTAADYEPESDPYHGEYSQLRGHEPDE